MPTEPVCPAKQLLHQRNYSYKMLRYPFLLDTIVLAALREKFQRGVISGNGAGSAALSGTPLPVSGHSYETLVYKMTQYRTMYTNDIKYLVIFSM